MREIYIMVNILFNFKGVITVVIILLFTQQSFASYAPMNCDDMKKTTIVNSDKNSHSTSQMTMHSHDSQSKDSKSSHEKCDACNSSDCVCASMGSCFGSNISTSAQALEHKHILFADHGIRFISQKEHPDSGVYLHLFKPPIYS